MLAGERPPMTPARLKRSWRRSRRVGLESSDVIHRGVYRSDTLPSTVAGSVIVVWEAGIRAESGEVYQPLEARNCPIAAVRANLDVYLPFIDSRCESGQRSTADAQFRIR